MEFRLIDISSGEVVGLHYIVDDNIYDFLLGYYPPEFFLYARPHGLYGIHGYDVLMPRVGEEHRVPWRMAIVVPFKG